MSPLSRYLLIESSIGAVINMVIGAVFFFLLFGSQEDVPLWGAGGLVVDCIPQGFLVGIASVLPPSLITRARLRKGTAPLATGTPPPLPAVLWLRTLLLALASMIALTGSAALLATLSGAETMAFWPAFAAKVAAGGIIAYLLTPPALHALLNRPVTEAVA